MPISITTNLQPPAIIIIIITRQTYCREKFKHVFDLVVRSLLAAVICVVTQRFSERKALRDDSNNGCEGDYEQLSQKRV